MTRTKLDKALAPVSREERISDYLKAVVIAKNRLNKHAEHLTGDDLERVSRDQQRLQEIFQEWAND